MSFSETINQMADVCRRDPAFVLGIKSALLESGLASLCGLTIDEAILDPFRPCPANWTAMQIAFFDNGELPKVRNRPKIQRTRMRYGANIMVWTRQEINFGNKAHVAWQANIHLWTAEEAKAIVRDLRDEGYVDDATVEMIDQVTDGAGEGFRFSVPLLKNATGTRWMRQHLVATSLKDGRPDQVVVLFPDGIEFASSEPFPDYLADGKPLSGKAILQARFARNPSLAQWASEIIC